MSIKDKIGSVALSLGIYQFVRWVWDVIYPITPTKIRRTYNLKKLLRGFVNPGDLVFDIGANKGDYTDVLLSLGAHVVAVEPNRRLVCPIRDRFRNKKVDIIEAAASDKEGVAVLHTAQDHGLSSINKAYTENSENIFKGFVWKPSARVYTVTLDSLIEKYGTPSFIKIDIEGAEIDALNGLSYMVPAISFEWTGWYRDGYTNCIKRLCDLGYTRFNFTITDSHKFHYTRWGNSYEIMISLERQPELVWGDVYARTDNE